MVRTNKTSRAGAVADFARDLGGNTGLARSKHNPHNIRFGGNGRTGSYAMLESSTSYFRGMWNHIQFGADSLPSGVFQSDGVFFEGRLTGAGVDTVLAITLRIRIQNVNGGDPTDPALSFTTVIPQYMVIRIEILPDGSATEDTIYPDQLFMDQAAHMNIATKALIGGQMGWDTTGPTTKLQGVYDNQTSYCEDGWRIHAGDARNFDIPIHSMLTQAKIFLPGKKQDPRIRVVTRGNIFTTDSAITAVSDISLVGVQFITTGILYDDAIRDRLGDYYASNKIVSRVLTHERQTETFNGILPNTPMGDVSLTVMNGAFANMDFYVIRNEAAQQNLYNSNRVRINLTVGLTGNENDPSTEDWIPVETFSLQDSSGNPVFFNGIYADFMKGIQAALGLPDCWVYQQLNIYPINWAMDLAETVKTGRNTGGMYMDSKYHLKIVGGNFDPDNQFGTTTTNYVGVFIARRYAYLCMKDGQFEVTKL